jgi:hypothetical protein
MFIEKYKKATVIVDGTMNIASESSVNGSINMKIF